VAARVGCSLSYTCLTPGHDELDYDANYQQHVQRLTPIAQMLAEHDIRFALEFIGPKTLRDSFAHTFIYTADKMLEFCADITPAGAANVGLLVDSYHVYTSAASEQYLNQHLTRDNVFYVHVNDARPDRTRDEQMDLERVLPCESGVIDSAAFVRVMRRIGYDGPVTAEPFDDTLIGADPDQLAQRIYQSISKMLALA
jgi:sugar phosphate isomerase/epimerase